MDPHNDVLARVELTHDELVRLQRLNELLEERQRRYESSRFRSYWGVVYVGSFIPLPTFQYGRFWHEFIPQTIYATYLTMSRIITVILAYLPFSILFFLLFHVSFSLLAYVGTSGPNFITETITFLLQDYPELLRRKSEMIKYKMDVSQYLSSDHVQFTFWELLLELPMYSLASVMLASCSQTDEILPKCLIYKNGLLFKFADIFAKHLPYLQSTSAWSIRIISLSTYYIFLIIKLVVTLNGFLFFFFNYIRRFSKHSKIFERMWGEILEANLY